MAQLSSTTPAPLSVLWLEGPLDLGAYADVRRRLLALDSAGHDVVADLENVTFIDCVGIGSLLRCRREVESAGGRFSMRASSGSVDRLLRATRTETLLRGTLPDALPEPA